LPRSGGGKSTTDACVCLEKTEQKIFSPMIAFCLKKQKETSGDWAWQNYLGNPGTLSAIPMLRHNSAE